MSRLYLILILFFAWVNPVSSQSDLLKKYLIFASEQYNKGDYFHAAVYYEKAMQMDSNTVDILWNYAETMRAYKDYRKAEYYYAKVYAREEAGIYPMSILYWGLMQKQNGKYKEALETFKKASKKYAKKKKEYPYRKAKQEIESCLWAISAMKDTVELIFEQLPETVNTKNSEFGHSINRNSLYFSSLRADSIAENEEVYGSSYKTHLFKSNIDSLTFEQGFSVANLNSELWSSGNGSFSLDGKRFYFSKCSDDNYNYRCKIMVARYDEGVWSSVDSLGTIINAIDANTTMPHIAEIDGKEVLFFSSDRKGGIGGMDIWMSTITNGNQYSTPESVSSINTYDNELTPFWSSEKQTLYFSSSWHEGFGGQDIFSSARIQGNFSEPNNLGLPINSAANDLYYFEQGDTSYFTSNRIGVLYSKNPTCCSDIFRTYPEPIVTPPTKEETLEELAKRLPVTLYFHNDIPDPRSRDTLTKVNYIASYDEYTAMKDIYQKEYSKGLSGIKAENAVEDIDNFFLEYVDQGVKDLVLFRDLLLKELQNGARINITIQGFASPLAKTDYNVNLTKRRISSLLNYLRAFDNGVFVPYLDNNEATGGKVIFSQVPFGEYTANQVTSDNPHDVQNSVYSRAAAIERKIEIQSVSYLKDKSEFPFKATSQVQDLGQIDVKEIKELVFKIKNLASDTIHFEGLESNCECLTNDFLHESIAPDEELKLYFRLDLTQLQGFFKKETRLKLQGFEEELKFIVTGEVK